MAETGSRPDNRPEKKSWRTPKCSRLGRTTAAALIIAYLATASFPDIFVEPHLDLDRSWVWGINVIPTETSRFGAEVVFSYGPLGFLLFPLDVGSNLILSVVFWITAQALLVGVAAHHLRRTGSLLAVAGFGAGYLAAVAFGVTTEYRLLILVGLLLSISPQNHRRWWIGAAGAGALAGVLVYTKVNAGIAAVSMLAIAGAIRVGHDRASPGVTAAALGGGFLATTVGLSFPAVGGPSNMLPWVARSAELAAGYPVSMALQEPPSLVLLGAAGVLVFSAFLGVLRATDRAALWLTLPLVSVVLFSARHAYVRHGGRQLFPSLVAAVALGFLVSGPARRWSAAALGVVILVAAGAALNPMCLCDFWPGNLGPGGMKQLAAILRLPDTRADLRASFRQALGPGSIPPSWATAVRSSGQRVDVIPSLLLLTKANRLPWEPNPVLQTYHAYTEGLDRWTAEHFAGSRAPGFVLVQFTDIDKRHPMFGAPAMWRAILAHYEPWTLDTSTVPGGRVGLLRRRPEPVAVTGRPEGTATVAAGRWTAVPATDGLLFARFHFDLDLGGRLASLLWRVEPVYVDVRYVDGARSTARLLPATAGHGVLLDPLPRDLNEFLRTFGALPGAEVDSFRIRGPGLASYGLPVGVEWMAVAWPPAGLGG